MTTLAGKKTIVFVVLGSIASLVGAVCFFFALSKTPVSSIDLDADGVPDVFELKYGMKLFDADENSNGIRDGEDDFEGDQIRNKYEVMIGTSPWTKQSGPANFRMTQNADRSCDFTWEDRSGGAHGYVILRTNDDGTEHVLGVAPAGVNSFHWRNDDPE